VKAVIIEPGGLNIELAILFAANGYETGYYSEYHEAFPTVQRKKIGTGFKNVQHFTDLADALEFADIVICPDTHSQHFVKLAKKYGKPTWGTGRAEYFEQDRLYAKQMLKKLDLPVGKYYDGIGLLTLEQCLRHNDDLFVKFPGDYRGIGETRHHYDWSLTKRTWWGSLLNDLGPLQENIKWIAEVPIDHIMEVALDQLVVNGQYSMPTLMGIEAKDSAYIGKVITEIPDILQVGNDKLAPYLKTTEAKTFISLETMIGKDGKAYITDPCLRTGHPVNAVQLRLYENICQFIVLSSKGLGKVHGSGTATIQYTKQYGIALEVKSTELDDSWLEVQFDEERRHTVHLQCAMQQDDAYFVIPKAFIAATIVGLGDTLEQAEKEITKTLESFSCQGMYYDLNSITKIKETMKKGEKYGIKF
jgi:hypothetical protein